jgi:hypothetical protein
MAPKITISVPLKLGLHGLLCARLLLALDLGLPAAGGLLRHRLGRRGLALLLLADRIAGKQHDKGGAEAGDRRDGIAREAAHHAPPTVPME